jgi:probable F420-dependent oxidoreductase
MRGIPWENPVQKTREYVNALRGPLPIMAPAVYEPVPIYIAAHGPKMLVVAGEVADGANTYMQTPEHTTHARGLVGANKVLNVVLPCCLTTDPAIGRAVGRAMVSIYLPLPAYQRQWASQGFDESDWTNGGSDRLVDTYVAWGSIETIHNRMQEHIDAGANSIIMAAGGYSPENSWELLEATAP